VTPGMAYKCMCCCNIYLALDINTGITPRPQSRSLSTRTRRSFQKTDALPFAGSNALSSSRPTLTARQERLGSLKG